MQHPVYTCESKGQKYICAHSIDVLIYASTMQVQESVQPSNSYLHRDIYFHHQNLFNEFSRCFGYLLGYAWPVLLTFIHVHTLSIFYYSFIWSGTNITHKENASYGKMEYENLIKRKSLFNEKTTFFYKIPYLWKSALIH